MRMMLLFWCQQPGKRNTIYDGGVLTVGTSGGEYVVSTTNDGPITPTTLIRKYSNYGSANADPVQVQT